MEPPRNKRMSQEVEQNAELALHHQILAGNIQTFKDEEILSERKPSYEFRLNYNSVCFGTSIMVAILGLVFEIMAYHSDRQWDEILSGKMSFPKVDKRERLFSGKKLEVHDDKIKTALNLLKRTSFVDAIFIGMVSSFLLVISIHLIYYCVDIKVRKNLMLVDGIYIIGGFFLFLITTILGTMVVFHEKGYLEAAMKFEKIGRRKSNSVRSKFNSNVTGETERDYFNHDRDLVAAVGPEITTESPESMKIRMQAYYFKEICLLCAKHLKHLDETKKRSLAGVKDSFTVGNESFTYTHGTLVKLGFCEDESIRNAAFIIFMTFAFVCWVIPCIPCVMEPNGSDKPEFSGEAERERYLKVTLDTNPKAKRYPLAPLPPLELGGYPHEMLFPGPYAPNTPYNPFTHDYDDPFETIALDETHLKKEGEQVENDSNDNQVGKEKDKEERKGRRSKEGRGRKSLEREMEKKRKRMSGDRQMEEGGTGRKSLDKEMEEKEKRKSLDKEMEEKEKRKSLDKEMEEKEKRKSLDKEMEEKEKRKSLDKEMKEKEKRKSLEREMEEKEKRKSLDKEMEEKEKGRKSLDKELEEKEKRKSEDKKIIGNDQAQGKDQNKKRSKGSDSSITSDSSVI